MENMELVITALDEYRDSVNFTYKPDEWDSFDYGGLYLMVYKNNQCIGMYNQSRVMWVRTTPYEGDDN